MSNSEQKSYFLHETVLLKETVASVLGVKK